MKLLVVLGRFGGALLHPRRTLEAALEAPGSTAGAVLVAGCVVGLCARPMWTAHAVAMGMISVLVAIQGLLRVLAGTVLFELVGVALFAWLLHRLAARRPGAPGSEGVQAAAALTLVPFFVLMLVGALLEHLGLHGRIVEALPQAPWRLLLHGRTNTGWIAIKLGVAYVPTVLELSWLTFRLLGRRDTKTS